MNETTISETIVTLHNTWWFMVPLMLCLTYHVGGLLAFAVNSVYRYVNRSTKRVLDWPLWVMGLFFKNPEWRTSNYTDNINDRITHDTKDEDMPWFYFDFGKNGYCEVEGRFTMLTVVLPMLLMTAFAVLHFTPLWVTYGILSTFGTLWVARLATDGFKKGSSVLKSLEDHKKDKSAHS